MSILVCYDGSPSARRALDVAALSRQRAGEVLAEGHTAVEPDLLGSVSAALVHHATRPVLVVPSPPSDSR